MIRYKGITIDRENLVISNRGVNLCFQRANGQGAVKFVLLMSLILGPVTISRLDSILYDGMPDSAPLCSRRCIYVMLCRARGTIARLSLVLRRDIRGGFFHYWLEPTPVLA